MERPYTVSLDLYRGAAYIPFARQTLKVLAASALEACSLAERDLNIALGDVEYAAATQAVPVWQPGPVSAQLPIAMAA